MKLKLTREEGDLLKLLYFFCHQMISQIYKENFQVVLLNDIQLLSIRYKITIF